MPNASTYIIDVANIKPGGNDIKGLWVGNSESKYAMLGNTCIYDKVLYEIDVDDITNVEPNAQTVTISNYTSKKTHGNGDEEELFINPSTKQITANTSTASTKDTTFVVNQALALDGTITGSGVTVTITQKADYPTSIVLSISPNSQIPAGGGYITSALTNYTYSVKATYKSGNSDVDVTSSCTITANKNSISANSRDKITGETISVGTITFTAKYNCNDVEVSDSKAVTIWQQANTFPDATYYGLVNADNAYVSCGPIPVTGGTVYPSTGGSLIQWRRQAYTSGSYDDDWIDITSDVTVSYDPSSVYGDDNRHSTDSPKRGTVTATWTSPYRSQAGVETASKSVDVYQKADSYSYRSTDVQTEWSTTDSSHIPTGGGSRTASWWTTRYHYYYWDSDDAYYTTTTDNEGTATLTATNGTLNRDTITNGKSVTITAGSSSSERTVSIYENIGGRTVSWTQDGPAPVKPEPRIISYDISFTSYDPPTPTTPTFHMSNSSNVYDLYGNFTISIPGVLAGDWHRGTSRDMYLAVPFNITGFSGAVLKGSVAVSWPSKVRITIGSNYYDMNVSISSSDEGVVNWTGTIPISQDDNVVISFL